MSPSLLPTFRGTDQLETDILVTNQHNSDDVRAVLDQIGLAIDNEFISTTLQKELTHWLTSILRVWIKKATSDDVVERASHLLSSLSTLQLELLEQQEKDDSWIREIEFQNGVKVKIRERSCGADDTGVSVWMAGCIFAYFISCGKIPVNQTPILELGCGTGIVGITAGKHGAKQVLLTDYHPGILQNAVENVRENGVSHNTSVFVLDWNWLANPSRHPQALAHIHGEIPVLPYSKDASLKFDTIFGADICYDPLHAQLVPPVCSHFLSHSPSAKIYIITALRECRFASYTTDFETQMKLSGFRMSVCENFGKDELLEQMRANGRDNPVERKVINDCFKTSLQRFRFYVFVRE